MEYWKIAIVIGLGLVALTLLGVMFSALTDSTQIPESAMVLREDQERELEERLEMGASYPRPKDEGGDEEEGTSHGSTPMPD